MPNNPAMVLVLLAAVVGSASMVAAGMWLYYRVKRLERENDGVRKFTERMDDVSEQVEQQQAQIAELYERLDFSERMLARERKGPRDLGAGEG